MDVIINLAIGLFPCFILFLAWGKRALPVLAPSLLYIGGTQILPLLPVDFVLVAKSSYYAETVFYLLLLAILSLMVAHSYLLSTNGFSVKQIVLGQAVQIYSWISLWFMLAVTIQGGK